MFNPLELMGKLKEMQSEMEKTRSMLDDITVTSEAGGGMVKVTANANRKILRVEIDRDIIDPSDKEMIEDLVAAGPSSLDGGGGSLGRDCLREIP